MISDIHKIIFVHPEKSGGTSVEKAFDAKIVTDKPTTNEPISWFIMQQQVFSAAHYKASYPNKWRNYRKIAIVRNPADRFLSRHRYFLRHDKAISDAAKDKIDKLGVWSDLLNADIRHQSRGSFAANNQQTKKLGNTTQYDYILTCEKLSADWEKMKTKLGLESLPKIGHANSSGERVDLLDYVVLPHLRGKLAIGLRSDLDAFHYKVAGVTAAEQAAILKSMSSSCKGAACDLSKFLKRVYPVSR